MVTHYYFMACPNLRNIIKEDDFLEWEEVYRIPFYGTLKSEGRHSGPRGKM